MVTQRILLSGGTGQLGLGFAQAAVRAGYQLTLLGRSPLSVKHPAIQSLVTGWGCDYVATDIYDEASEAVLAQLAAGHDHWVNCAEPYRRGECDEALLRLQADRLYRLALAAGYTATGGKRFVRVGSPPPELTPAGVPIADGDPVLRTAAFRTAYFRAKRVLARAARAAAENGLAIVTAAPTGLLGPWSMRGSAYEPMLNALRGAYPFNLMLPAGPTNVVALDQAVKGILAVLERGRIGEVYQLGGLDTDAAAPFRQMLQLAGRKAPRLQQKLHAPGLAIRGTGFMERLLGKRTPWYLYADFYALMATMGHRSSEKAIRELGYAPSAQADIDRALQKMLEWYRETGLVK